MKRFLIVLVLLAAFANLCLGRETMHADAAYGVKYVAEQVVELPRDQQRPYLTIIGSQSDPRFQTLCDWFDRHPTLRAIKDQTHFNAIPTQSPHFLERLSPTYRETPCIRLQDASGNIVAEFAGNELPFTSDALARGLNTQARNCFRRPDVDPAPQPLMPAPQPQSHFPWILLGGLTAAGAGLGLAKQWHDTHKRSK